VILTGNIFKVKDKEEGMRRGRTIGWRNKMDMDRKKGAREWF
jgi:hypothetical protein